MRQELPSMSPERFLAALRRVVVLCWLLPPVFGLGFLVLVVEMFTVDQLVGMMIVPPLPLYCLAAPVLADLYFRRWATPISVWLADPRPETAGPALSRARRFPLHFWVLFLAYLILAPAMVMASATLGTDFRPRGVDWFRIELVSLIVSIIVGLPIFFLMIDLFGRAFRDARIERPQVTIRTKVFLIGALVPLLIDTMLVQYYWTETGHFTRGTFLVWLVLELLAVAGALLFVRSFGQALSPLDSVRTRNPEWVDLDAMAPRSTDELGVLAVAYRDLLARLQAHSQLTELKNSLLRADRSSMAEGAVAMAEATRWALGADRVLLALQPAGASPTLHASDGPALEDPESLIRRGAGRFGGDELAVTVQHGDVEGVLVAVGEGLQARELTLLEGAATEIGSLVHESRVRELAAHAQRRFQQLNELSPDGVVVLGAGLEVLEANPMARSLLGEQALGHRLVDAFRPGDRQGAAATLEGALTSGRCVLEVELVGPEEGVQVEIHARRIEQDGPRLLAVVRDVTERHALQQQLIHSQRMDGVGQLAGGIAHDFNNILTAINAGASFLRMDLPDDHPSIAEVDLILEQSDRAAKLTGQLLAFSRKQVLAPRAIGIAGVVSGALQLLHRLLPRDITLVQELEGDWKVAVDPLQLEQVVMNLVVNARDAMPDGGTLTVSIHQGRFEGDDMVSLVVSDTGHGIAEEHLDRVFEPYFTTKPVGKGTGLGLSTAYGIVRQSGGSMYVQSRVGTGTTFEVRLPRTLKEGQVVAEGAVADLGQHPLLVVDDDEMLRSVMVRALQAGGYRVLDAPNGSTALQILDEQPVSMLITDLVMPGMLGTELVEQARRRHPTLAVLVVSGYADDVALRDVHDQGLTVLRKPFTPSACSRPSDADSFRRGSERSTCR